MKFKTMMTIKAIVCLGFGPVMLFFPAWLLDLLGLAYSSGAALTSRMYGATLFGNLLLTWLGRSLEAGPARRAICWDLFVYDAIGLCAALAFVVYKVLNPLGCGVVAIYLFFTAGFGYFLLPAKKSS